MDFEDQTLTDHPAPVLGLTGSHEADVWNGILFLERVIEKAGTLHLRSGFDAEAWANEDDGR